MSEAAATMPDRWVMESNRVLRLFTIFILYVAQGIPIGLFWFAIPTWMAVNGASAADVGSVLALTALPWSLKFINGFIMDRYTFLAMGRRRAWVLGGQLAMVAVFIAAAIIQPGPNDVAMLGLLGLVGNAATTIQDVAVDGMCVDLLEEDERAKGGAMMFGGQLIGTAAATAATGWAIANLGATGAYLVAALLIGIVSLFVLFVRERAGERAMPWSAGAPHPKNAAVQLGAWWPLLKTTFLSVMRPVSLFFVPVLLFKGAQYGVMTGAQPLIATGEAGMSETRVTAIAGTAQLIGGLLGLTLGGWAGDRFGAKWSTITLLVTWLIFNAGMALSSGYWVNTNYVTAFIISWFAIDTLISVVVVPIAMRLSAPKVAATQFAIYMAVNNMGISLGAVIIGLSDKLGGLIPVFWLMLAFNGLALLIMLMVKFPRRQVVIDGQTTAAPLRD